MCLHLGFSGLGALLRDRAFEPVAALPAEPGLAAWVGETDQDGAYAADGLNEGDYVIRVAGVQTKSIHVSGDTLLDIELP